jgi:hypothetical protein
MISIPNTDPPSGALQKDSNQSTTLQNMPDATQHGRDRALTFNLFPDGHSDPMNLGSNGREREIFRGALRTGFL